MALSNPEYTETPEDNLIVGEVKLACLQGMLLCLSSEVRLAFILGVVFEVDSSAGGYILGIAPEAFPQRLSRGRRQIQDFMLKSGIHQEAVGIRETGNGACPLIEPS